MIFEEKSRKVPETGGGRISITINDSDSGPKLKWPILMIFYETTRKLPQAGSDRISAMAIARPDGPKQKWSVFDDI
jgi:hypothetical protein